MTEAPHGGARAPATPPLARALVAAMRAVPFAFTVALGLTLLVALASGRGTQAALFGGAFLLALSVAARVTMLDRDHRSGRW